MKNLLNSLCFSAYFDFKHMAQFLQFNKCRYESGNHMKKLLNLIKKLLRPIPNIKDALDEKTWEHLDGAEFFVVFPKPGSPTTAE